MATSHEHTHCRDYGVSGARQNPFCHPKLCQICKVNIVPQYHETYCELNNYCIKCGYVECSKCKTTSFELCIECEHELDNDPKKITI